MKSELIKMVCGVAAISLLAVACSTEVVDEEPEPNTSNITQQSSVSECGGFAQPYDSGPGEDIGYCDAEVLDWSYDAATQTLSLIDSRIELNCCGERESVIEKQGDVYVITQTDSPEMFDGQGARCGCMCVFDFALDAQGIEQAAIEIEIIRHVTDDESGPQTVFTGTLDLTQGASQAIVDPNPSDWCGFDQAS